jgi:hypothetical protein
LRTKARYHRWDEELKVVRKEMDWTIRWFEKQEGTWKKRASEAAIEGKHGHQCYAEKQQVLWRNLKSDAIVAFGDRIRD